MQLATIDRITAARRDQTVGHVGNDHALCTGQRQLTDAVGAAGGRVLEHRAQLAFHAIHARTGGRDGAVERLQGIAEGGVAAALQAEAGADDVAVGVDAGAAADAAQGFVELGYGGGVVRRNASPDVH